MKHLAVCAAGAAAAVLAAGSGAADAPRSVQTSPLGLHLREVSGLAPAGPQSVFAHNDELGVIYEIKIADGAVLRSFTLGRPPVAADFEAIVRVKDTLYLTTSAGRLYEARIPAGGGRIEFRMRDSGVGAFCEIEGLAERRGAFLFLCKRNRDQHAAKRLRIYEWSPADKSPPRLVIDMPFAELLSAEGVKNFVPSDLALEPGSGDFLILSARGGVLRLDAAGRKISYAHLDRRRHPQPEGVAAMPDGRIVIADEGKTNGALSTYGKF